MEEKLIAVDTEPENAEEKTEIVEEGSESTEEVVADKTDNESKDKKGKVSWRKIAACMELAVALMLITLSGWLFWNTRGTRLLYVSVATGRVSRYYWLFLAIAAIFLLLGVITLKHRR